MSHSKRYTKRMRGEYKGQKCEYCDHAWEQAKSNYLTHHGVCLFCHQRLNDYCAHGAAWILKRRGTLRVWNKRLLSAQGNKRVHKAA